MSHTAEDMIRIARQKLDDASVSIDGRIWVDEYGVVHDDRPCKKDHIQEAARCISK